MTTATRPDLAIWRVILERRLWRVIAAAEVAEKFHDLGDEESERCAVAAARALWERYERTMADYFKALAKAPP